MIVDPANIDWAAKELSLKGHNKFADRLQSLGIIQVKVGYVKDVVNRRSSKHRLGSKRARSQLVRGHTTKSRNYQGENITTALSDYDVLAKQLCVIVYVFMV